MAAALLIRSGKIRGLTILSAIVVASTALAQAEPVNESDSGWQWYDWLNPSGSQAAQATGASISTSAGQDVKNPFEVLSTGSLWQEKVDARYTRQMADTLTLSYESTSTLLSEASNPAPPVAGESTDDLTRGQKVGLQFQPSDILTLSGNVHDSTTDAAMPGDAVITTGAGFTTESHLPTNSTVTLGVNSDHTADESSYEGVSTDTTYDAQIKQPLGNLPLSAELKGHYEELHDSGLPVGRAPSLEQSVTWKPVQDTTVQMGLRQQQYQEYPGIDNQFNEALFADFSQKLLGEVTWHSYAELLNSRGLIDQAPASPIASGSNGTQQATPPGSNTSPTSSLPISMQDQTLTFSTGPSFQLQKDISASIEYSDRWDKTPAAGSVGQEQRVSLSVKGSF